jgi:hypothetical protein
MTDAPMTRRDRDDLAKLARRREKLAKADTDRVASERLADFEQQMAAIYRPSDDEIWSELHAAADEAVAKADAAIAERCRELGIPKRFRPGLQLQWYERGENAAAQRRSELRAVAKSRIDAMAKLAKVEIERQSVEVQTVLIAGGLDSDDARAFLASMPTADALIGAAPSVAELEQETPHTDRYGRVLAIEPGDDADWEGDDD